MIVAEVIVTEHKIDMSDANLITRRYFDSILVKQHLIGSDLPSLKFDLFGASFDTPVMMPAFSHLHIMGVNRPTGMREYADSAAKMNTVNWVGMMENEAFDGIVSSGAKTVRIVKPYADRGKLRDQLLYSAAHGAFAVGVDIDHAFSSRGGYDNVMGEDMRPLTAKELEAFASLTGLPFIVKGVLGTDDALACVHAGVSGIVISHHHGRLPYAVPPLMALPGIRKAVAGRMKLFVDCGIETGADVYKCLALGADAVCLGRGMMAPLRDGGTEGLCGYIRGVNEQLAMMMCFTGIRDLKHMDPDMLVLPNAF